MEQLKKKLKTDEDLAGSDGANVQEHRAADAAERQAGDEHQAIQTEEADAGQA